MKVIDLKEAKSNLEQYGQECQTSPVIVTQEGKPIFELIPFRSDDPEFLDRIIAANPAFRSLLEERRRESDQGMVVSLEEIRQRLNGQT